ncbi:MAG: hypothetical protein HUK40_13400 [Desulfobacter sp.]|nr:hypothetical protein [Desulfobacter sp.]
MLKLRPFHLIILVITAFFLLFSFSGQASIKDREEKKPDMITIDLGPDFGKNEMAEVTFLHDLHSLALDQQCLSCHDQKKEAFDFSFIPADQQPSMESYHDKCIACHVEKKAANIPSGPMAEQCGACHQRNPSMVSSRTNLRFDKSLHYVHVDSAKIKGKGAEDKENCSACHHRYNSDQKELVYTKGEEESCAYCHGAEEKILENKGRVKNIRQASHQSCVACHQEIKTQNGAAGPISCGGCHDSREQEAMALARSKKNMDIPRLKRGQPDQVLLTPWEKEIKDPAPLMPAVAFDHKFHEDQTLTCKSCHHESLKKCSDCHTPGGGEENGGFISLADAMHSPRAEQSCIGCHQQETTAVECAGCHARMPDTVQKDPASCKVCHTLAPEDYQKGQDLALAAAEAVALRSQKTPRDLAEKIPETVVIEDLSQEYEPSQFPHGKVVRALMEKTEKSALARAFHRDPSGLCMGCHHNSPASLEPPKCGSCHDKNGPGSDKISGKPGLKGAFHGQCITCHQEMKVTQVPATDCVKCHELKK